MDLQDRLKQIDTQQRSYTSGGIELINDQWIFFNDENDEASLLEEIVSEEIEIYIFNRWQRGKIENDGRIKMSETYYRLENGDKVRVKKSLTYAYTQLLEELCDSAFVSFTNTLNKLAFSLYDCIYCHYQQMYQNEAVCEGVNFIIFDNTELTCSVHHHFCRGLNVLDRFEYTVANGKRVILQNI